MRFARDLGGQPSFVETRVGFSVFLLRAFWMELMSVEHSYRLDLKPHWVDLSLGQVLLG